MCARQGTQLDQQRLAPARACDSDDTARNDSRDLKRLPFRVRCSHWESGGSRCEAMAVVTLHAPDSKRVPGSNLCIPCAQSIVNEYAEKLHEHWTVRELVILEDSDRPAGRVYCLMNYAVQSRDVRSGATGCFLFDQAHWISTGEFRAVFPVFADLAAFHNWNRENGSPGGPANIERIEPV
jgi:hypothetical protein